MKKKQDILRTVAVLIVLAAVVVVVIMKGREEEADPAQPSVQSAQQVQAPPEAEAEAPVEGLPEAPPPPLPKLVDLGSDSCIPCKKMAPILETLKTEFAGRFDVQFIDVRKNPAAGRPYRIRVIPTQIFLNSEGTQLFRHEGFFSREDILGTWKRLGFEFEEPAVDDLARQTTEGPGEIDHKVTAYYFHGDMRCITCLAIEDQARAAIEKAFSRQMEAGTLQWQPVNFDKPENSHFIEEYALSMSSLVLVHADNGEQKEWKILEDVWELVDLFESFDRYVEEETRVYLERHM
jgi:thioredoxin 1